MQEVSVRDTIKIFERFGLEDCNWEALSNVPPGVPSERKASSSADIQKNLSAEFLAALHLAHHALLGFDAAA